MNNFINNPPEILTEKDISDNNYIIQYVDIRTNYINNQKYYWSPKRNSYILISKRKNKKKTYLQRIVDSFEINKNVNLLSYNEIFNNVKNNCDAPKIFDERYLIKALIKGIGQNILEKIEIVSEKNKYKGHNYKLLKSIN